MVVLLKSVTKSGKNCDPSTKHSHQCWGGKSQAQSAKRSATKRGKNCDPSTNQAHQCAGDLPPRVATTPCFGGKNCDPLTKQPHQCRGGGLWSLSHSPQENIGRMLRTTLPSDSRNYSLVRALGWGLRAVSKSLSFAARSRDGGNHENPCPPELGKFKNPVGLCEGW